MTTRTGPDGAFSLMRFLGLRGGRCRRCGEAPPAGQALCGPCAEELAPRLGGYCPSCGAIFAEEAAPISRCADCRKTPPPWSAVVFHGAYAGALADLVLELKYGRRLDRAGLLSEAMARAYRRAGVAVDLVVPVPLHSRRLRRRGFNQSAVLGGPLAQRLGVEYARKSLERVRDTPPQASLPRRERLGNIAGAFAACYGRVAGRRVLLVDDIMTTGATAREACTALVAAGASDVVLCVAARA